MPQCINVIRKVKKIDLIKSFLSKLSLIIVKKNKEIDYKDYPILKFDQNNSKDYDYKSGYYLAL